MIKNISTILACCALFIFQSCCFSTKNTSLGNKIYVSEYSVKQLSIMYCTDRCCNSGLTVIPQTIVAYNFNEKWIVAKSDSNYNSSRKDFAYWIFNKEFSSTKKDLDESIKANLLGPLDSVSYYKLLSEKSIQLELINYLPGK